MINLGHLPTELLSLILPRLSQLDLYNCSLINKHFYALTIPLLWESPRVRHCQSFTTALLESPPLGQYVYALRITYLKKRTTQLQWMNYLSSQLISLTIGDASVLTDDVLIPFFRRHPQLETLSLQCISSSITEQSFEALGQYCHQLKHLTLATTSQLSINIFLALTAGCRLLGTLEITFDRRLFNFDYQLADALDDDDDDDLVEVDGSAGGTRNISRRNLRNQALTLVGLRHLQHIRLHWTPPEFIRLLMISRGLKNRMTGLDDAWPPVTRLELQSHTPLFDRNATALIRSHPRLQHLSLDNTTNLTNTFLDAIPTCLPDLETLHLMVINISITSEGLRRLVQQCPSLTHVSFPYWSHICSFNFPEATRKCLGISHHMKSIVHQLDQETINRIRLDTGQ